MYNLKLSDAETYALAQIIMHHVAFNKAHITTEDNLIRISNELYKHYESETGSLLSEDDKRRIKRDLGL